jgi:hypothetical protein
VKVQVLLSALENLNNQVPNLESQLLEVGFLLWFVAIDESTYL